MTKIVIKTIVGNVEWNESDRIRVNLCLRKEQQVRLHVETIMINGIKVGSQPTNIGEAN